MNQDKWLAKTPAEIRGEVSVHEASQNSFALPQGHPQANFSGPRDFHRRDRGGEGHGAGMTEREGPRPHTLKLTSVSVIREPGSVGGRAGGSNAILDTPKIFKIPPVPKIFKTPQDPKIFKAPEGPEIFRAPDTLKGRGRVRLIKNRYPGVHRRTDRGQGVDQEGERRRGGSEAEVFPPEPLPRPPAPSPFHQSPRSSNGGGGNGSDRSRSQDSLGGKGMKPFVRENSPPRGHYQRKPSPGSAHFTYWGGGSKRRDGGKNFNKDGKKSQESGRDLRYGKPMNGFRTTLCKRCGLYHPGQCSFRSTCFLCGGLHHQRMCGNNVNQTYRQRAYKAYPSDKDLAWSRKPWYPRDGSKERPRKFLDDEYGMDDDWSDGYNSPGWGYDAFAGDD
jgi:hypothetical protein